jgi:hypothetical protein
MSGWTAWTFDDLSYENLKDYLASTGDNAAKKASEKAGATRDDLVKAAQSAYASASSAGGSSWASATSYIAKQTDTAKANTFETWSDSELKSYLDSYGIVCLHSHRNATVNADLYQPVPQGSTTNELRALARRQWTYFKYGTSTPSETIFAKLGENAKATWDWVMDQLSIGSEAARKKAQESKVKGHKEL